MDGVRQQVLGLALRHDKQIHHLLLVLNGLHGRHYLHLLAHLLEIISNDNCCAFVLWGARLHLGKSPIYDFGLKG